MLCSACSNINVDELIPSPSLLQAGFVSGTGHHARYVDLEAAARSGCELCRIIESSSSNSAIQLARVKRVRKFPVQLKMLLQGNQSPGYRGGTKLLVTCGGEILAKFEAYVARGRNKWIIAHMALT
jgi:hypothetical protein